MKIGIGLASFTGLHDASMHEFLLKIYSKEIQKFVEDMCTIFLSLFPHCFNFVFFFFAIFLYIKNRKKVNLFSRVIRISRDIVFVLFNATNCHRGCIIIYFSKPISNVD